MKAFLEIKDGAQAGHTVEIARLGSYTVGRRSANDLKIAEEGISRKHCRIDCDGEFYWLVDCGSRNGTRVNSRKITRTLLYNGDVIQIGHIRLVFMLEEEETPKGPDDY